MCKQERLMDWRASPCRLTSSLDEPRQMPEGRCTMPSFGPGTKSLRSNSAGGDSNRSNRSTQNNCASNIAMPKSPPTTGSTGSVSLLPPEGLPAESDSPPESKPMPYLTLCKGYEGRRQRSQVSGEDSDIACAPCVGHWYVLTVRG